MFKNVLVGVDGRPNGRDAVALAERLTDPDGTLTLAHVRSGELHPLHAGTPGLLEEEQKASEQLLEETRAGAGLSAKLLSIVALSPGRGLHTQAEEQGADLIVVGSSGRSALGRVMLGDDTRTALNGAPCAVAVAARDYADHPVPIARIGVGYDESPESVAALAKAKQLAKATDATVQALEVLSIPTYAYTGFVPPITGETIDEMLKEASARLGKLDGVDGHAVYGLTGEELAAFGDSVDLLVVGSRNYGPVRRLVLGSTSDYLERHARCSLLVLPRVSHDGAEADRAGGERAGHEAPSPA